MSISLESSEPCPNGIFSAPLIVSCVYLRQKEDPWDSIGVGAATRGFLSLRAGMKSASRSAILGGVMLALIEELGSCSTESQEADLCKP
jgi:hypothetical protein